MPGFSTSKDYVIEYSIDGGQTWQHGRTVLGGAVADADMRLIQRRAVCEQARDAHGHVGSLSTRILAGDDPRGVLNQPVAPKQENKSAADLVRTQAESYASDARKFSDAGKLGKPILSAEQDAHWALVYRTVADELRKCAAELADQR